MTTWKQVWQSDASNPPLTTIFLLFRFELGMPCIDGKPREFAMQDEFAAATKKTFPRVKV